MTPDKIAVDAGEAVVSSPGTAELDLARPSEQPPASTAPYHTDHRPCVWIDPDGSHPGFVIESVGQTVHRTTHVAIPIEQYRSIFHTDTAGRSASPGSAVPCRWCEEGL